MRPKHDGQYGIAIETVPARRVFRVGLAALVGCALFVSGINEPMSVTSMLADLLSAPASTPECPGQESDEGQSSETETVLGLRTATRWRFPGESSTSQVASNRSIRLHKPGLTFLSHPAARAGELENRNGVGATLRC